MIGVIECRSRLQQARLPSVPRDYQHVDAQDRNAPVHGTAYDLSAMLFAGSRSLFGTPPPPASPRRPRMPRSIVDARNVPPTSRRREHRFVLTHRDRRRNMLSAPYHTGERNTTIVMRVAAHRGPSVSPMRGMPPTMPPATTSPVSTRRHRQSRTVSLPSMGQRRSRRRQRNDHA